MRYLLSKKDAFTIIEILVTLSIIVLLTFGLYQLWTNFNRYWKAFKNELTLIKESEKVISSLSQELKGAKELTLIEETRLKFLDEAYQEVEYSLRQNQIYRNNTPLSNYLESLKFTYLPASELEPLKKVQLIKFNLCFKKGKQKLAISSAVYLRLHY
jgi:prepilin-type N-terminal cleavage/methylation domain-containing protein